MGRAPGERRIGSFRLQPSLQPTQDCISHASVQRSRDALIVEPGDGFQIVAHSKWREDLAAVCALCDCRRETGRILRGRNLTIGGAVDDKDRGLRLWRPKLPDPTRARISGMARDSRDTEQQGRREHRAALCRSPESPSECADPHRGRIGAVRQLLVVVSKALTIDRG